MAKLITPADAVKQKMDEFYVSVGQLAKDVKLSQSLVRQLLSGKTKISIPVAFKLAKYFNTTFEYWYGLQTAYEFAEFKKDAAFAKEIKEISKAKKPSAKEIAAIEAKKEKPAKKGAKAEAPAKRGRKAAADKVVKAPVKAAKAAPVAKAKAAKEPAKRASKTAVAEKPVKRARKPIADTIAEVKPRARRSPKKAIVEEAPKEKFVPDVILIKNNQNEESQTPSDSQWPSSDPEPTLF